MSATSAATFSIWSSVPFGIGGSSLPQPKPFGVRFNSQNSLASFNSLKATMSLDFGYITSLLAKGKSEALPSLDTRFYSLKQEQGPYKVAILGAAGGIGQPLAFMLKISPLVSATHLYDIANVKEVADDLRNLSTPSQVLDFTGASELANCLKGVNIVIVTAGVPREACMTSDHLFNTNANIVMTLVVIYCWDLIPVSCFNFVGWEDFHFFRQRKVTNITVILNF